MRFHSAMATLEPQKYVIARTVGTENILLVSGRLVKESEQKIDYFQEVAFKCLFLVQQVLFGKANLSLILKIDPQNCD